MILALLQRNRVHAMSTYEIGLWIKDNRGRPISIIVKNLADDSYIRRVADAGKRAGLWSITTRGTSSLLSRQNEWVTAERWLGDNPNFGPAEVRVMGILREGEPLTPSQLSDRSSLPISPVRTAIKRLVIRRLARQSEDLFSGYHLTASGRQAAISIAAADFADAS